MRKILTVDEIVKSLRESGLRDDFTQDTIYRLETLQSENKALNDYQFGIKAGFFITSIIVLLFIEFVF